jgi:hypothetical protein
MTLGERIVRNDEVVGSIPTSSTTLLKDLATLANRHIRRVFCSSRVSCSSKLVHFNKAPMIAPQTMLTRKWKAIRG